jgi:hypothetical protein
MAFLEGPNEIKMKRQKYQFQSIRGSQLGDNPSEVMPDGTLADANCLSAFLACVARED